MRKQQAYMLLRGGQEVEIVGIRVGEDRDEEWPFECLACVLICEGEDYLRAMIVYRRSFSPEILLDELQAQEYEYQCRTCGGYLGCVVGNEMVDQPYHDDEAFNSGMGVCYIPEHSPRRYTRHTFLDLVHGNERLAQGLYALCEWQLPETLLLEGGFSDEEHPFYTQEA